MSYEVSNFENDVIRRSYQVPVLVDFWAEWCGPCRMLSPVLEAMARESNGKWVLVKVDTEANPELAMRYRIQSIPNVKLFVNGEVVDEFAGALPRPMIEEWLSQALPDPNKKKLLNAVALLESGNRQEAQSLLEEVVADDPTNEDAAVLLAKLVLFSDRKRATDLVEPIRLGSKRYDEAESIRLISRLMELNARKESLPEGKGKELYAAAIESLASGDLEAALKGFIEVIRKDRQYDDDGSRKACIAIFKYLGEDHPMTREYRRIFSSSLYI